RSSRTTMGASTSAMPSAAGRSSASCCRSFPTPRRSRGRMATTFGDLFPFGEAAAVTRHDVPLPEALTEAERLSQELEKERVRGRRLEEDLRDARRLEAVGRL